MLKNCEIGLNLNFSGATFLEKKVRHFLDKLLEKTMQKLKFIKFVKAILQFAMNNIRMNE